MRVYPSSALGEHWEPRLSATSRPSSPPPIRFKAVTQSTTTTEPSGGATQAHLVTPIDRRPLALRVTSLRRILAATADRRIVSFIRPTAPASAVSCPGLEVAPHRRHRHRLPILALDQ